MTMVKLLHDAGADASITVNGTTALEITKNSEVAALLRAATQEEGKAPSDPEVRTNYSSAPIGIRHAISLTEHACLHRGAPDRLCRVTFRMSLLPEQLQLSAISFVAAIPRLSIVGIGSPSAAAVGAGGAPEKSAGGCVSTAASDLARKCLA